MPDVAKYERQGYRFVCLTNDKQMWARLTGQGYDESTQRYGDSDYYWENNAVWRYAPWE